MKVYGEHEDKTIEQLNTCADFDDCTGAALMADGHLGYSVPIGGVVAYEEHLSPSAVGFDISCGNAALCLDFLIDDEFMDDLPDIMDEIQETLSFGVGRQNNDKSVQDHELFDYGEWNELPFGKHELDKLKSKARKQLGTIGSGNHYVDLLADEGGYLWIANHFGSRGLGHTLATAFMKLGKGLSLDDKLVEDDYPIRIFKESELGYSYRSALNLADAYALAGREYVVNKVMDLLGFEEDDVLQRINCHHNSVWYENGSWVHRKGATPLNTQELAFVGGSMGDFSAIITSKDGVDTSTTLGSAPHGSGRIMSRTKAAGKFIRTKNSRGKRIRVRPPEGGLITPEMRDEAIKGVEVRGGGLDEAPQVYRKLKDVLSIHSDTVQVVDWMYPIGVVMADANEFDPYKD